MVSFDPWLDRFEDLSLRERVWLLLVVCVAVWLIAYLLWLGPQWLERQTRLGQLTETERSIQRLEVQFARLQGKLKEDPDLENRLLLQSLQKESQNLDNQLKWERQTMISPDKMPEVLQGVLDDLPLVLVKLRKLPPEVELDSELESVPKVYRHTLHMELEGTYEDTLDYLERLENLPWRLAWETLDIQMQRYPKARILLHLYTLSFEEEWLGV